MKLKTEPKILIFIGIILLLNVVFPPPAVPEKFDLREGEVASLNIIAPYDFYIPKNEQELFDEREEIARRIPPVFELDNSGYKNALEKINAFEYRLDSLGKAKMEIDSVIYHLQKSFALNKGTLKYMLKDSKGILKKLRKDLSEFYAVGIVDTKTDQFRIITILSGNKEMLESTDRLFSVAEVESIVVQDEHNEYRDLLKFFMMPNITFNKEKTEERINEVFANVPKTKGKVLKGEMVAEKHKRVTTETMQKIKALENTFISIGTWEILRIIILRNILYLSIIFLLYNFNKITKASLFTRKNLYFIALLSAVFLVIGKITYITNVIYLTPIAFFIFLFALYFNFYIAIVFTFVFAALFGIALNSLSIFVFLFVSGIVATFSSQTVSSRLAFYRPLIYLALANVGAIFFIEIYLQNGSINLIYIGEGILNSILVNLCFVLFLPLFEKLFDFTTDLTLLELGNLNLSIFKEMAIEAPGTYHHSIVVGSLAEAGASNIGADPILARVGAYYHDIGKFKKPEYFIENQIGMRNPHDNLKPQMSALIIISHVKEGIDMAKKMKLPKKLIEIIEQHHGTTTLELFYKKALNISSDINQDAFRYPGPRPKIKESALVMLADSVEAAARSERNITVSKLQKIVKDNIERKFNDGQLDECPINRHDLEQIKTAFLPILTGIFHPRIEYDKENNVSKSLKGTDA